MISGCLPDRA